MNNIKCKSCKLNVDQVDKRKICATCVDTKYCVWPLKNGNLCPYTRININVNYCNDHICYSTLDITRKNNFKKCVECKYLYDNDNDKFCNTCLDSKICVWPTKDGKQCYRKRKYGVNYCKIHENYANLDINKINEYKKCGTCKLLFDNIEKSKYACCGKCRNIGEQNRKNYRENIIKNDLLCVYIHKTTNERCKYKKNNECEYKDYCGNHQSHAKYINEINNGNNLCRNWIRGCNAILNNGKKTCDKCLNYNRDNDIQNYNIKKGNSIVFNYENKNLNNRMCYICNKIVDKSLFKKDKCSHCYEVQQKNELNCNRLNDEYSFKYKELKRNCKEHRRNLKFELEKEECIEIWNKNCIFCNTNEKIGIDRIDPSKGYIKDNIQPCCFTCNIMKGNRFNNNNDFISAIKYILSYKKIINDKLDNKSKILFKSKDSIASYSSFITDCNKRKIKNRITKKDYELIIKEKCYYCGNHEENGSKGIDRKDSKIYYNKNNTVSCCKTCNFTKSVLSEKEFLDNLLIIYSNYCKIKLENELPQYTKIDLIMHTIMNKTQEEYTNLLITNLNANYNPNNFTLEYVNTNEQINNWNYYINRYNGHIKNKILSNSKTINFFVKYNNDYAGMISLDKDTYANKTRDDYIKWSEDIKMKNFNITSKVKFIKNFTQVNDIIPIFISLLKSEYVNKIYKNINDCDLYLISIYDNLINYKEKENFIYIKTESKYNNNRSMVIFKCKDIDKFKQIK